MKKLMIAAAIVCAAACAQAGTISWSSAKNYAMYVAGSTSQTLTSAYTAYLFDANDASGYTQNTLLEAFNSKAGVDFSKALDNTGFNDSGVLTGKATPATASQAYSLFVVVQDTVNDNIFISAAVAATGPVADDGNTSKTFTLKAPSQNAAFKDYDNKFTSAGWYAAAPEPTTGLLMLIGMAGLALRRRRA